ncbi:alpha-1,6-glucosidase domain-containing protein [Colwellia piezophila]|uniref:alpha-1,6-glucosidase domain-containing protein n=1 Tax=Colwellia piezophila TaxID=211668 RepID=UPI000366C419|nr:alpha-1,6-glucosidase domain-containing protein [Colwellia piezophila]
MLTTSFKQILICTAFSSGLVACGGGSDDGGPVTGGPLPPNDAPTITSFAATVNPSSTLDVTFSWVVADANDDALSCELNPGEGIASVTISDCLATTSTTVTYQSSGGYNANLSVSDPSAATNNQDVVITVEAENALPDPVVTAGENELVIFYNRADNTYTGWGLHLWVDDAAECTAYDGAVVEWSAPVAKTGDDANYGAYWVVSLKSDAVESDCVNYIMHKGDNKAPNDADQQVALSGERMIWLLDGVNEVFTVPTLPPSGVLINDTAAHWTTLDTVFWHHAPSSVSKVRVYSSAVDDLAYDGETGISGDNFIEFLPATNSANSLGMPRYNTLDMFEASNPDSVKAKQMLTGKLLAIAYNSDNTVVAATYLQTGRVLDALYTAGNSDADEAELGLTYTVTDITASLWAPTAQQVSLHIYNDTKELQSTETMVVDSATGVWSFTTPIANDRVFYRYELTVYHHTNQKFETLMTTDPYSVSLSTNGMYSQFVNLMDADLKPADWDTHTIPVIAGIEDAIIYEGNIRDFSIRDVSTSEANRGKYLAFTEENSVPVTHLKALVAAGLTHFQILPANDIASVDEDFSAQINLTNTVAELCSLKADAPVCGVEDSADTLLSVFESYDPSTEQAKLLTKAIQGIDGYNFGYDPKHFNAPDGNFSTDADGVSRIIEMRSMNKALHDMGLRTSLDVVYNHTNTSSLWDNSVLDKVVPGYYYRRDLTTGNVMNATCCHDTETEHRMMDKLMIDSLVMWATEYKFDAFRFDIMGSHSKTSILNALAAVKAVDADTYFYGEGWSRPDEGYEQAGQYEMAGTEVGTFNDRPRDTIRGASLFNDDASLNDQDIMRLGLSGTLQDYQLQDKAGNTKSGKDFSQSSYAKDPADIINYVSKHDGSTLWDKLQYGLATDMAVDDRVRAQNISITMPILSQGIPFLQIGGDLLRSKSMDKNSYDNGDWYNLVDFTKESNNWNVGLPIEIDDGKNVDDVKAIVANAETTVQAHHIAFASQVFNEFLAIRASSKLFRLATAQDVYDRVGFHNTGTNQTKGLIVMSLDDGTGFADIDTNNDAIVVVINGTASEQSHTVATASGFELHSVQQTSADTAVQTASFSAGASDGTFTVPALTTAVFVKPRGADQGAGLSAGVTRDAPDIPPYGNNTLYVRGSMNNDGADGFVAADTFTYQGNGVYSVDTTLTSGLQTFTITSIDSVAVDLGFSDVNSSSSVVVVTDNANSMDITVATAGSFTFTLDASASGDNPILTISSVSPTVDCSALVDSADAIPFSIAGDGELYVKGDHSGWGADEAYRLHYKGNNIYQAVADFDGAMNFKLASSDGSWTTQLWAQAEGSTEINGEQLTLGVSYPIAYNNAGTDNNQTTLAAGSYSFLLTLNDANPAQGANVGSLIIQQCQP